MSTVIIIYSILLSLLIGGYITLLFEVRELKKFKDVFGKFMKTQRDLNNSQVEHDIKVIDIITQISNEIGKELERRESDVRESDQHCTES